MSAKRWLWVFSMFAAAGCGESDGGGVCLATVVERDSVVFELFDAEPDAYCPSSFDTMASHVQWVAEAWGTEPSTVEYELFESRAHPCWPCPPEAGACGIAGRLGTTRLPDRHEAAHAARGTNCTSLIEEGWATLYANPFEGGELVGTLREAVAGVEANGRLPGEYYPLAARFVAFLIESYGIETVRELCAIRLASEAELDAAVQQVLGLSVDEVQLALDEYPPWTLGELRQDQACDGSEAPIGSTSATIELGCMADGVEGRVGGPVWNHQLVEIPELDAYTFEFETSQAVELWIELRNCEREGLASTYHDIEVLHPKPEMPATLLHHELPAGTYVVRAMVRDTQDLDPDFSIGVSVGLTWP